MSDYRIRCAFSTAASSISGYPLYPVVSAGRYVIMYADQMLMGGRTFSRDDAEAIRDALKEAHECGMEEGVEA